MEKEPKITIIQGSSGQEYENLSRPLEEGGDKLLGPVEDEVEDEEDE